MEGFSDVGTHKGLLAVPCSFEGVVLPGLPLLALGLLESAHQPLHPLMHPKVCPRPPLPAWHQDLQKSDICPHTQLLLKDYTCRLFTIDSGTYAHVQRRGRGR